MTASGGIWSAVLGLQRVVFRYVFWAHSSPSFAAYNVFSWPTSLADRALSLIEMGGAPCGHRPAPRPDGRAYPLEYSAKETRPHGHGRSPSSPS
jgi:hypothetical protein